MSKHGPPSGVDGSGAMAACVLEQSLNTAPDFRGKENPSGSRFVVSLLKLDSSMVEVQLDTRLGLVTKQASLVLQKL